MSNWVLCPALLGRTDFLDNASILFFRLPEKTTVSTSIDESQGVVIYLLWKTVCKKSFRLPEIILYCVRF
ncbi:MAG: hypothetical protein J6W29_01410 [Neisseriaceae bacterium]|nr:hypothetical protein [Neisseriaceae bacterium]